MHNVVRGDGVGRLAQNRDGQESPVFRPFDPDGELRIYYRALPHWRQPGATYFVTFRQGDSIPRAVLAQWKDTRNRWLSARGIQLEWSRAAPERFGEAYRRIPSLERRHFERQQARMLHDELDFCHGSCVLRRHDTRQIVADALHFFHGRRLWLGDFVVMPNHVHLLIQPFDGWELEDLLASIKRWTSRHIRNRVKETAQMSISEGVVWEQKRLWQPESYDRIVRDKRELTVFRQYIASNPREAKLLDSEFTCHQADWP